MQHWYKWKKHFRAHPSDLALFIGYVLFAALTYEWINRPFGTVHSLWIPLDAKIPLIKELIVVYYLYFPVILWTAALWMLRDRSMFHRMILTLFVTQGLAYVIYFFYQTEVPVYDTSRMGEDIFTSLLRFTYTVDNRYAAAPSLHVCNMLVTLVFFRKLPIAGWRRLAGVGLMLLIASTTVLVKQHVVLDIPLGILHALLCLWLVRWGWKRWHRGKTKAGGDVQE